MNQMVCACKSLVLFACEVRPFQAEELQRARQWAPRYDTGGPSLALHAGCAVRRATETQLFLIMVNAASVPALPAIGH